MAEYYKIIKDGSQLGPFTSSELQSFVQSGLVLKRDKAYNVLNPGNHFCISDILLANGISSKIEHKGNVFSQLKEIGKNLIVPPVIFTKQPWVKDHRLVLLCLVGLTLSIILSIAPLLSIYSVFYLTALYFAGIWGMFFHYLFRTEQVRTWHILLIFFGVQVLTFIIFDAFKWNAVNPIGRFVESNNVLLSAMSCIFGIGISEEFVKVIPIFLFLYFSKQVIQSQTAVFYGLISGVAFGVFEGVQYQLGPNFQLLYEDGIEFGYATAYLSNIARLTYLPFLHAIWCGIAAYFASFAFLYPRFRVSLVTLCILVPAVIHGLYDFICINVNLSIAALPFVLIGVILLIAYLNNRYELHSKLYD